MGTDLLGLLLVCLALLTSSGCGDVRGFPATPTLTGNYTFTVSYDGGCSSEEQPGQCSISPVVILQNDTEIVVQPIGQGRLENLLVIFVSDELSICDLSSADLTFTGVYDGSDIGGMFSGTAQRVGFGPCGFDNEDFLLMRID